MVLCCDIQARGRLKRARLFRSSGAIMRIPAMCGLSSAASRWHDLPADDHLGYRGIRQEWGWIRVDEWVGTAGILSSDGSTVRRLLYSVWDGRTNHPCLAPVNVAGGFFVFENKMSPRSHD